MSDSVLPFTDLHNLDSCSRFGRAVGCLAVALWNEKDAILKERMFGLSNQQGNHVFKVGGHELKVKYLPGESDNRLFGRNSNWRGPIWFPVNYLLICALQEYHLYYGDTLKVECLTGSGRRCNPGEVAADLAGRLANIFLRDPARGGRRAVWGDNDYFQTDLHWRDYIPFHEYFHGDSGSGVGASHQTGWTALIASLLFDYGGRRDSA
jgi:hypothetical protein